MSHIKNFLWREAVPIWWSLATSLLSAIAGGIFVLFVVPHFSRGFENEKIRTAFILGKLTQLDAQSNEIAVLTNEFVTACSLESDFDTSELARQTKEERFKLSLLSIEISAMIKSDTEQAKIDALNETIASLAIPRTCPSLAELSEYSEKTAKLKLDVLAVSQLLSRSAAL
ncbi:hypothetical protein HPO_14651 [Hyphomonas polymorpha PS728]|uniref:Uncharacterized protein n=1 Tax=Hyphomonas polymorpha PS728 TaxID=1280954 RepID=A0A062VHP0_9PROT|nr:hypothetical protein [Hyphomonas polymorpha]KCZ97588.1 hypothetical protein HPO_14651 [Hyphomonas polymorpha PS728]